MELFRLFGSILVDNAKANESISKTDEKAEGLANKLGSGIKTAAKWGAGIATAAGVVGGAMLAATNKTAEYADHIDKLSERTGINREELQRWEYAADQSGADINKLEVGVKTLSASLDSATKGSKNNTEAFKKLGLSLDELKKKSQEDVFADVMKALADMPEGYERNALGAQVLGKSYTEMLPLLNAGSDGMQELMDRADELGLVMSEDAVRANVKFGDTMADIKLAMGALGRGMTTEFLPIMQGLADWVMDHMPEIQEVAKTAFEAIAFVAKQVWTILDQAILPVLNKLYNWVRPYMPAIQKIVEGTFQGIAMAINAVIAPIERVISLFRAAKEAAENFFSSAGSRPIVDDFTGEVVDLSGARANGGPVIAGKSYLVGERGAEVFTPSSSGVISSGAPSTQGGITQNIYFTGKTDSPSETARKIRQVNRELATEWGL